MKTWLFFISIAFASSALNAATYDHSQWNALLKQHVYEVNDGKATQVDYQGFAQDKTKLQAYLDLLSQVSQAEFDKWQKPAQLAFLINAYNAWTVDLILTKWPDLESIKDLGSFFRSPWSKEFIPLLGKNRSLDDIEHKLIRGSDRYQDPRIHFAVNCASIGCPALRAEAYDGKRLESQLEEQTQYFLEDRSRNRLNGDVLELSSIFKWYKKDFEKGWKGYESLEMFLIHYASALSLNAQAIAQLQKDKLDIEFLDYDWDLNQTR